MSEDPLNCDLCGEPAAWVENKAVYGRNYGDSYMIWLCPNRHYVGCHQNTKRPKGTFADKETRNARMAAHAEIDPLWKSGKMQRGEVYRRLKEAFGREIHIGGATKEECSQIVKTAQTINY